MDQAPASVGGSEILMGSPKDQKESKPWESFPRQAGILGEILRQTSSQIETESCEYGLTIQISKHTFFVSWHPVLFLICTIFC